MHQSRLFELLRTLSPQERQRLRWFVASPYFSRGEWADQLIALLDLCLASLHRDSGSGLGKAEVYAALFPGETPVAGKLEKRMSALHGLAMQFLLTERYFRPENKPDHQIALAQEFRERGLPVRAGAALKTARQLIAEAVHRDSAHYARGLRLVEQEMNHAILQSSKASKAPINEHYEALFLYYHTVKQELAIVLHSLSNRNAFQPSALTQRMLGEEPIPHEFLEINPALYFGSRYIALVNQREPDLVTLNRYIEDLRQREHFISEEEIKNCWTMARNLLIHWWNSHKNKEYIRLYLDLALDNVSRGYLYHYGKIHPYTLETICKLALEQGMYDLAYRFLTEHRGKISGEPDDEPFFRYSLANYHFYTGALDEALDLIPFSVPDISHQLHVKILEIKILYETGSELLPYRMDALRMYVDRSGSRMHPPGRLKKVRHFLNVLARIHRCPVGNRRRAETIIASIEANPGTIEYHWLLEKAAERAKHK